MNRNYIPPSLWYVCVVTSIFYNFHIRIILNGWFHSFRDTDCHFLLIYLIIIASQAAQIFYCLNPNN